MIGPVNALLRVVGIAGPSWLSSASSVLVSLAGIATWENVGFNMVLFMAGLTTIPRELYAAAEVDGARSRWAQFWLVTWPLLGPTSLFVLTITLVRALTSSFDLVMVLTQGGPDNASAVILFSLYQQGFTYFRLGYAAAITLMFLVIVVGVMWLQNSVLDKRVHYG
jgi:multiple sugar transport system permease protein